MAAIKNRKSEKSETKTDDRAIAERIGHKWGTGPDAPEVNTDPRLETVSEVKPARLPSEDRFPIPAPVADGGWGDAPEVDPATGLVLGTEPEKATGFTPVVVPVPAKTNRPSGVEERHVKIIVGSIQRWMEQHPDRQFGTPKGSHFQLGGLVDRLNKDCATSDDWKAVLYFPCLPECQTSVAAFEEWVGAFACVNRCQFVKDIPAHSLPGVSARQALRTIQGILPQPPAEKEKVQTPEQEMYDKIVSDRRMNIEAINKMFAGPISAGLITPRPVQTAEQEAYDKTVEVLPLSTVNVMFADAIKAGKVAPKLVNA